MKAFSIIVLIFATFYLSCSSSTSPGGGGGATTYFVDPAAGGTGTGGDWGNAFTSLSAAVAAASSGDQVWVVSGVYTSAGTDRNSPVVTLVDGVTLIGSFEGTETDPSERTFAGDLSVLDGGDSLYHVVVGAEGAVLDGFVIRRGNADGTGDNGEGGGVFINGVSMHVRDCTIEYNFGKSGGGLFTDGGDPTIEDCYFYENSAGGEGSDWVGGGGMTIPSPLATV